MRAIAPVSLASPSAVSAVIRHLATRGEDVAAALRLAETELGTRADVFTLDALAWAWMANENTEQAWIFAQRAVAEGTQDGRLFLHAGVIASAAGQSEQAVTYLAKAIVMQEMLLPSERKILAATQSANPVFASGRARSGGQHDGCLSQHKAAKMHRQALSHSAVPKYFQVLCDDCCGHGSEGREMGGVARLVKETPYSIGYVELAYAIKSKVPRIEHHDRASVLSADKYGHVHEGRNPSGFQAPL